jgi:DUF1365 family protein
MLLRYPLKTLKVVFAIHFEAVRLMLKASPCPQSYLFSR